MRGVSHNGESEVEGDDIKDNDVLSIMMMRRRRRILIVKPLIVIIMMRQHSGFLGTI